jgi:hypothetical protein
MLEELLAGPGARTLVHWLALPETRLAVVIPGLLSLAILGFYFHAGRIPHRLQRLWLLALPVSYFCAHWQETGGAGSLYIYSAFSVVCVLLVFKRVYLSPALAFALTFLSLFSVDVTHAFCRALECGIPLEQFYLGVGGGGARDALLLVPAMTAAVVAYATRRIRARGEALTEL